MRMYIASLKIYVRALTVPSFSYICFIFCYYNEVYTGTLHMYMIYRSNLDITNVTDFKQYFYFV